MFDARVRNGQTMAASQLTWQKGTTRQPNWMRSRMPLHLYPSLAASEKLPQGWKPDPSLTHKSPVHNKKLLAYLRSLAAGKWQKVYKYGVGGEVHYFEYASGQVADVKFFDRS